MKTVLMAIAVIKDGNRILLRKFDPARNPYDKPWGLFGGRLTGEGTVGGNSSNSATMQPCH